MRPTLRRPMTQQESPTATVPWRLELFYKSLPQLQQQVAFLKAHNITRVNIPNKDPSDDLAGAIQLLRREIPDVDICCHFSCKNQKQKAPQAGLQRLEALCTTLEQSPATAVSAAHKPAASPTAAQDEPATAAPVPVTASQSRKRGRAGSQVQSHQQPSARTATAPLTDTQTVLRQSPPGTCDLAAPLTGRTAAPPCSTVLLVSGGGKKTKTFDTVSVLESLSKPDSAAAGRQLRAVQASQLTVAFNPYLPEAAEQKLEQERLRRKLATGLVTGLYLQMGSDLRRLEEGLRFIKAVSQSTTALPRPGSHGCDISTSVHAPLALWGSVVLPTKQFLARMKFRPWSGVHLSEEFLGSVEAAERITQQVLQMYAQHGVVPLFESSVQTDAELSRLHALMRVYTAALSGQQ